VEFGVWLVLAHVDQRALFGAVPTTVRPRGEAERARDLTRAFLALLGVAEAPPARSARRAPRADARPRRKPRGDR
jgi:hypothetical protein